MTYSRHSSEGDLRWAAVRTSLSSSPPSSDTGSHLIAALPPPPRGAAEPGGAGGGRHALGPPQWGGVGCGRGRAELLPPPNPYTQTPISPRLGRAAPEPLPVEETSPLAPRVRCPPGAGPGASGGGTRRRRRRRSRESPKRDCDLTPIPALPQFRIFGTGRGGAELGRFSLRGSPALISLWNRAGGERVSLRKE